MLHINACMALWMASNTHVLKTCNNSNDCIENPIAFNSEFYYDQWPSMREVVVYSRVKPLIIATFLRAYAYRPFFVS